MPRDPRYDPLFEPLYMGPGSQRPQMMAAMRGGRINRESRLPGLAEYAPCVTGAWGSCDA